MRQPWGTHVPHLSLVFLPLALPCAARPQLSLHPPTAGKCSPCTRKEPQGIPSLWFGWGGPSASVSQDRLSYPRPMSQFCSFSPACPPALGIVPAPPVSSLDQLGAGEPAGYGSSLHCGRILCSSAHPATHSLFRTTLFSFYLISFSHPKKPPTASTLSLCHTHSATCPEGAGPGHRSERTHHPVLRAATPTP